MTDRPLAGTAIRKADTSAATLEELLSVPVAGADASLCPQRIDGVKVGSIVGFAEDGSTPLVIYPDQPTSAALRARTVLALDVSHIGRDVVLMFSNGSPCDPIVLGCLVDDRTSDPRRIGGQVEVAADGERMVISANEQIVLRCGRSSLTLTKDGKVIVKGAYISQHSSGVMRIKGGAVQIN